MIVCSCNVLSDHEVRTVVSTATCRTPSYVHGCLGCKVQCGRCAQTIRQIMEEVLDPAEIGCSVTSQQLQELEAEPKTGARL